MDFRAGRLPDGSRDPSTFGELAACVCCRSELSTLLVFKLQLRVLVVHGLVMVPSGQGDGRTLACR